MLGKSDSFRVDSGGVVCLLAERITRPEVALSGRELEILEALATGKSNKELAQLLIDVNQVRLHCSFRDKQALGKLLIRFARGQGF